SDKELLLSVLRKKPVRTVSGVTVVAVMTSPMGCPHGKCIPCPGGPSSNTPQSYTGHEPAAMRAITHNFDPYQQTRSRLKQLETVGHPVDKIDFIVMGGTFTARDPFYQEWFIKRCFDGLNSCESNSLRDAQKKNENTRSRCIGLTIETRPDWFRVQHLDNVLRFGCTRVELGVQTTYDTLLYKMRRGHTVTDTVLATKLAKDAGLKVCYHMMPGLPGSNTEMDMESFKTIFEDQRFRPDMLKIYPTLVVKGTELYEQWKSGGYKPLTEEEAVPLIASVKALVPEWVRIQRVERDVPATRIDAGVKASNLRQLVQAEMRKQGKQCRCIRCREYGHVDNARTWDDVVVVRRQYRASDGVEVFLSLEDRGFNVVFGYLRLRLPANPHRCELARERCMVIRELKVVGREIPLGETLGQGVQHRGLGRELLEEAGRISGEEFDCTRLFVLSGIGVKEYYRRLGFKDDGVYLSKKLL
ncbi:MAG TPA: tRNA uridine(34) 5-carboxymethylaminomethyl modification radical SAM/GNAT enzyme Elp3, partial [Thermoplasmatales archaeon]|nr:tRNA uridine(34) 5-carboxymethylaminomethyl modification radical SAM/GNAT enzyme Elp3 [Thermoplasmatales archaeon]